MGGAAKADRPVQRFPPPAHHDDRAQFELARHERERDPDRASAEDEDGLSIAHTQGCQEGERLTQGHHLGQRDRIGIRRRRELVVPVVLCGQAGFPLRGHVGHDAVFREAPECLRQPRVGRWSRMRPRDELAQPEGAHSLADLNNPADDLVAEDSGIVLDEGERSADDLQVSAVAETPADDLHPRFKGPDRPQIRHLADSCLAWPLNHDCLHDVSSPAGGAGTWVARIVEGHEEGLLARSEGNHVVDLENAIDDLLWERALLDTAHILLQLLHRVHA